MYKYLIMSKCIPNMCKQTRKNFILFAYKYYSIRNVCFCIITINYNIALAVRFKFSFFRIMIINKIKFIFFLEVFPTYIACIVLN